MSANLAKDDLGTWKVEKKTILLVDDSTRLLNLVSKTLEKSFDIIAVDEPSDALQMAENFKPDLVLLDIHLPNVDGFDLLKRMSEHPITTDVPIVMMSGDDNIELKKNGL